MTAPTAVPEWFTFPIDPPRSGTVSPAADDAARSQALTAGAAHDKAVCGLQRLSEAHGGGVMGLVKGVLPIYERLGLMTPSDTTRVLRGFEALRAAQSSTADRVALTERLQSLLGEANTDATSTPAALAVLAILANDAAMHDADDSSLGHAVTEVVADSVGALLGLPAGPVGTFLASASVSTVVEHTHVELQWH
jgi:hypothetical protein